eukprot:IDg23439t1
MHQIWMVVDADCKLCACNAWFVLELTKLSTKGRIRPVAKSGDADTGRANSLSPVTAHAHALALPGQTSTFQTLHRVFNRPLRDERYPVDYFVSRSLSKLDQHNYPFFPSAAPVQLPFRSRAAHLQLRARNMKISLSHIASYSALCLVLVVTAQGQTMNILCAPKDLGIYTAPSSRIHVNCKTSIRVGTNNVRYFVFPLGPTTAGSQLLDLATQAKIHNRNLIIGFYTDRSKALPGCNPFDCRTMQSMLLL